MRWPTKGEGRTRPPGGVEGPEEDEAEEARSPNEDDATEEGRQLSVRGRVTGSRRGSITPAACLASAAASRAASAADISGESFK